MTTINDIHDLVELLQTHLDWAETLRNLILTRELLDLPQTQAQALQNWAETNQAIARLDASNAASLASQMMLHGRMGQLAGHDYEHEAERLAPRFLARELDVQDAAVLQRGWTAPAPEYAPDLINICRQALERGDINQEEDDDLFRADLVCKADARGSRSTPSSRPPWWPATRTSSEPTEGPTSCAKPSAPAILPPLKQ